jgi:hypothetical protein
MARNRPVHDRPLATTAIRATGLTAALALCGGLVLLSAGPAFAQDSGSSSSSSAPSGASLLGGWSLISSAAGLSADYYQPNFPLPETPALEFDVGYSQATYDAGPVGNANASVLWPGPVIAGGGSELPLLVDPYFQQYAGPLAPTLDGLVPTGITYPVDATSAYPQGPDTATNNNGPMSMDSSADASGSTASSTLGLVGGSATQSALPAGMLTVQSIGSTSQETIDNLGNAISEGTSTVHGIDIAGFIDIGTVASTATASSNGNQPTLSGSSAVSNVTIAGEPVSVSSSGVSVLGNNENVLGSVLPSVNQLLSTAGITITLNNPTDTVQGAQGDRQLDGLNVTINLTTYDQDYSKLISELPSSVTKVLNQIPVPTPYKQSITLDFGWVNVSAGASPPYNFNLGSTGLGGSGSIIPSTLGSSSPSFTPTSPGTGGSSPALTSPSTSPSSSPPAALRSAPAALFKGIGTGLIILGCVLAALLVGLLMGVDRAVGRLASTAPCVGEDTGGIG